MSRDFPIQLATRLPNWSVGIIIIIIIHDFQSDASPEELQGRCDV